ncbi:MAG: uncharacterized protein JWQ68_1690, partial [Cryobacterium sp.]|nr:uncharacterized protein [Cryobacterium sp.]
MFDDLRGRTAVITGGARGLGYSIGRALARQGVDVGLLDVLPQVSDSAAALAREFGVKAVGAHADVTDPASVNTAFAAVAATLTTPSILVTAAGVTAWSDSVDVDAASWSRVVDINLSGTFFASQAFARGLLGSGERGSAILISSMSGRIV